MPDNLGGKMLCFGYNKGDCTRPNCNMEHECQVCFGDHPATDCKSKQGWEPDLSPAEPLSKGGPTPSAEARHFERPVRTNKKCVCGAS